MTWVQGGWSGRIASVQAKSGKGRSRWRYEVPRELVEGQIGREQAWREVRRVRELELCSDYSQDLSAESRRSNCKLASRHTIVAWRLAGQLVVRVPVLAPTPAGTSTVPRLGTRASSRGAVAPAIVRMLAVAHPASIVASKSLDYRIARKLARSPPRSTSSISRFTSAEPPSVATG